MRRRAARAALGLAVTLAAIGCQVVAGIDGLTVDDAAGSAAAECGPAGSPCGGTCVKGMLTPPGTCTEDGACSAAPIPCYPYACDPSGTACTTICSIADGCADAAVCHTPSATCAACGSRPPEALAPCSSSCDRCEGDTCVKTCDSEGECDGPLILDTMKYPVVLECNDRCNGALVTCMGPYPCEVVCGDGGCRDLVMRCSDDGQCLLKCNGSGCSGDVKVACKANFCAVACSVPNDSIHQECGSPCSCMAGGCDGGTGA